MAKFAYDRDSSAAACNSIKFVHLKVVRSTVRQLKRTFEMALQALGRQPKNAAEAGLKDQKRGPKSTLGEENISSITA